MLALSIGATQAQVTVTATAGNTGPTTYATVTTAFVAVNAGVHQGAITLTVTDNTTEPNSPTALLRSGSGTPPNVSDYTSVLITCSGNVTINSGAAPTTNRGIIELLGADNVTIDGDDPLTAGERNLTIQMATNTTTGTQCIRLASNSTSGADGANNVTVKNCNIIGGRSSATSTTSSWGIIMSNGTNGTGGAYSSLNTLIENNAITRCYTGIGAVGASATYLNTGLVIRNNVLGSAGTDNIGLSGIHVSYTATAAGAGSAKIEGNDVRAGDNGTTGYGSFVTGILVDAVNAGLLIERNNVHDVRQPSTGGWGPAGIRFNSATNNADITVRNNFIRDMVGARYSATLTSAFVPYSIHITSAVTNLRIDNNTIANRVEATTGSTPAGTYANHLVYATAGTIASFRNNILVNTLGSTNSMAFYCGTNTIISGGAVDNNSYHVPSGQVGYYGGAARANLSAWQTATGKDANAVSVDPPFMSSTDLHINTSAPEAAALNGTGAVTGIVQDFDGDYRPTPPSIGADELSPLPPCDGSFTAGSITAPTAYCDGSPGLLMTLSGATGGAGISVQWRSATNSGGPYSVDLGTGLTQSTGVILAPRYYQVEVSCAGHGSLFTDEFEVDVNPLPTIAVTPSSASYCPGNPAVALTASGAHTSAWSPVTGLSGTTGATVDASPSASTTYTVLGTDGNGCQNSTTVTVTNNGAAPTIASVTATPNPTILGGNSQLMATASFASSNMADYTFVPSSGTFTPLVGGTVVSSIHVDGALSAALPIG
ncbi:MAG: hypothetical protein KF797_13580, partial [Flavobacteriales bacterium]|nr:hypothetical protein [Flavobacteriales bacterium]